MSSRIDRFFIAICFGALGIVNVNAQQTKSQAVKPDAGVAGAKKESSTPAGTAGAVVFVDPATRTIRQPTAAEIGTLSSQPQAPASAAPLTVINGPGGAIGVKLNDDSLVYTVARQTPDGKLATDCVTGNEAVKARMAPASPKQVTPKAK